MANCIECHKIIKSHSYPKRCINCYKKSRIIHLPKCLICQKELTNYNNKYCKTHAHSGNRNWKFRDAINNKNKCIDCKVDIENNYAKRCIECNGKTKRQENSPHWRGGHSTQRRILMSKKEYILWREAIFIRDGYCCVECGRKENIQAHHIKSWSEYPSLRYAINNGLTLCLSCHEKTDSYPKQFIKEVYQN